MEVIDAPYLLDYKYRQKGLEKRSYVYIGDLTTLAECYVAKVYKEGQVHVKYNITKKGVTQENIEEIIESLLDLIPPIVYVHLQLQGKLSLQVVQALSKKYVNLRFCGGPLLALEGCRFGCSDTQEIYYLNGCTEGNTMCKKGVRSLC